MSTRCFIGYRTENRTIIGVYCGHDGYPEHVGKILLEHYNTLEKAKELVSRGDFSSIGETADKCDWYIENGVPKEYSSINDIVTHYLDIEYLYVLETCFIVPKKPCWYVSPVGFACDDLVRWYEKSVGKSVELKGLCS